MKVFYFTGTGNCLYAAKKIGGDLHSIPREMKENRFTFEDDAIGFVFPCYAMGLPKMVIEFIEKGNFKADYFFAVMTYGSHGGAGLHQIERIAAAKNISFHYTKRVLMIDNYLPLFEVEDQLALEPEKKIEEALSIIADDIAGRVNRIERRPLVKAIATRLIYCAYPLMIAKNTPRSFSVDETCNCCGICEKVCPRKNIVLNSEPCFGAQCDACFACIHNCPQSSIHIRKEKSGMRFRNRNVLLKEIMDANSQLS